MIFTNINLKKIVVTQSARRTSSRAIHRAKVAVLVYTVWYGKTHAR